MVKMDGISKASGWKRGRPRFLSREDAEIGRQWLEKQTNSKYTVVKNPFAKDYYLRKKKL